MFSIDFIRSLFGTLAGVGGVSVVTPMTWASASQTSHKTLWRKTVHAAGQGEEILVVSCSKDAGGKKHRYDMYLRIKESEGYDPKVEVTIWGVDGNASDGEIKDDKNLWYLKETWGLGNGKEGKVSLYGSDSSAGKGRLDNFAELGLGFDCTGRVDWKSGIETVLQIRGGREQEIKREKEWRESDWMKCRGWWLTKTCEITIQDGNGLNWGILDVPFITYWAF